MAIIIILTITIIICIILICALLFSSNKDVEDLTVDVMPFRISLTDDSSADICILRSMPRRRKNLLEDGGYFINICDNVDVYTDDVPKFRVYHVLRNSQLLSIVIADKEVNDSDRNRAFEKINNKLFEMTNLFIQNFTIILDDNLPHKDSIIRFEGIGLIGNFLLGTTIETIPLSKHHIIPLFEVGHESEERRPEDCDEDISLYVLPEASAPSEVTKEEENIIVERNADVHCYKNINLNAVFIRNKPTRVKAMYQSLKGLLGTV